MPVRDLTAEELRTVNQTIGGLIFWDLHNGRQLLQKIETENKTHFKEFSTEWVKHLLKSQVRIWSETSLSLYINEQEAL